MLPDWLDADKLQWIILVGIALIFYLMFVVVRFIQKAVLKFAMFVVLGGLALSLWVQRDDLQNCVDTCECSLYGADVEIPAGRGPTDCG